MDDNANIIATLYPAGDCLHSILMAEMEDNAPHLVVSSSEHNAMCGLETDAELEGLQFRFDQPRRQRTGILFGTSKDCDVRLPPTLPGASTHQCIIFFDTSDRLVLRDLRQPQRPGERKDGTVVTYNGKGKEKRRNFTWILSGTDFTDHGQEIVIHFLDNLAFRVIVPPRDSRSVNNIAQFRQGPLVDPDQVLLGALDVDDTAATTAAASGAHTPGEGPIWIKRYFLGHGAFSDVYLYADVSTGRLCARKLPRNKRKYNAVRWQREIDLLGRISHEHVVRLLRAVWSPFPILDLEYAPLKTLHDQTPFSPAETLGIQRQVLSALSYLHLLKPPIIHRDIKPANLLVLHRGPGVGPEGDDIHIKLTDFGHSMDSDEMLTTCGTSLYLAPEVHDGKPYTSAVDLWSLGVMVFEFAFGFPPRPQDVRREWCQNIMDKLQRETNSTELARFLASSMLVMDPRRRWTAGECLKAAPRKPVLTAPSAPKAASSHAFHVSDGGGENQQTIRPDNVPFVSSSESLCTSKRPDSSSETVVQRRRPAAPPPSSGPVATKRPRTQLSPSSSVSQTRSSKRLSTNHRDSSSSPSASQDPPSQAIEDGDGEEEQPSPDSEEDPTSSGESDITWYRDPLQVGSTMAAEFRTARSSQTGTTTSMSTPRGVPEAVSSVVLEDYGPQDGPYWDGNRPQAGPVQDAHDRNINESADFDQFVATALRVALERGGDPNGEPSGS